MGMDVYGQSPTSTKGEYFRNNVWWWHPLWTYCENLHGDLADRVEHGHDNSGDGLDASEARELGERLLSDITLGVTAEYEADYNAHLATLPTSECKWCEGTGIRSDSVGVENGMTTKELSESDAIMFGRTHGWCNACGGSGKQLSFETNYPFSVENVREFAEFLIDCGGFRIC
jgi:DnaJ-class molecular chaperone